MSVNIDLGAGFATYKFSYNYQTFNSQHFYIDYYLKLIRETMQWKLFSCLQRCKHLSIPGVDAYIAPLIQEIPSTL